MKDSSPSLASLPLCSAHRIGLKAEALAKDFYSTLGFDIVEQRLKTPLGEIDLVCRRFSSKTNLSLWVLVEVKSLGRSGWTEHRVSASQKLRFSRVVHWFQIQSQSDVRADLCIVTHDDKVHVIEGFLS